MLVPVDATNSARQATIIAGEGFPRSLFISARFPLHTMASIRRRGVSLPIARSAKQPAAGTTNAIPPRPTCAGAAVTSLSAPISFLIAS
jgi:hypothetical protein